MSICLLPRVGAFGQSDTIGESNNVLQTEVCRGFRQWASGGNQRQTEVCRTFPAPFRPTLEFTNNIQSSEKKACAFNIVGMWRSEATSETNPVFYGFGRDGLVTVYGHVPDALPQDFEMMASVGYKLDDPAAPKRIQFTARRGSDLFRSGTTSMEIVEYGDNGFTTLDAESGSRLRWDRVQTRLYFLTFAARIGAAQPDGAAFAMWTKLDGRKTEIEALGAYLAKDVKGKTGPVFGPIPAQLYNEFTTESEKKSDVMIRLELTEAEFERSHKVFETWEKYSQDRTLPHRDPYLNGREFLTGVAENLNQCDEKLKLHTIDGATATQSPNQQTLEYVRMMRKKNEDLHVTDGNFPADWRPTLLPGN